MVHNIRWYDAVPVLIGEHKTSGPGGGAWDEEGLHISYKLLTYNNDCK